jgi:hypothetical protein
MLFQRYGLSRNNAREAYFNDREFAFDKWPRPRVCPSRLGPYLDTAAAAAIF